MLAIEVYGSTVLPWRFHSFLAVLAVIITAVKVAIAGILAIAVVA